MQVCFTENTCVCKEKVWIAGFWGKTADTIPL